MKKSGRKPFHSLLICGGLRKNGLFVESLAEACAMPVLVPNESEIVLVGSAMLAACASKCYPTLEAASKAMACSCEAVHPNIKNRNFYERKYKVFCQMVEDQFKYRTIMEN